MLLFKCTHGNEFDRHLDHMVSYQGMQSGLPMLLVGQFGISRFLCKNDCSEKTDFSYFSNQIIFGQKMILSDHLLITSQLCFDSCLFIKLKTQAQWKAKHPLLIPSFNFSKNRRSQ